MPTSSVILVDQSNQTTIFLEEEEEMDSSMLPHGTVILCVCVPLCVSMTPSCVDRALFLFSTLGSPGVLQPVYILPTMWQCYLFCPQHRCSVHFMLIEISVSAWLHVVLMNWSRFNQFLIKFLFNSHVYLILEPVGCIAVWPKVDSDTASWGKPLYSWASFEGGKFPFPTSFSACRSLFTFRRENGVGFERPHLSADLFTSSQFTRR